MNFLRKRSVCRFIAVFLLITVLQSTLLPYYTFALTSGPHQPEYTSYEDAGSTDMVNLITGDFGFNIPLLEIPGPEGNFAVPLSYHSGIGLEQESSWVGLGWNINAGAINRDINQYPDDASGESHYVTVQDLTGVTGWNKVYNHPFRDDWNSQTGYHGNVNLLDIVEVDFGNRTNVGIVGVHVGDGGVTFDPAQFSSALTNIVSFGTGSVATSAASIAKQAAISMAISTAVSFAMPTNSPNAPAAGSWHSSKSASNSYNFLSTNAKDLAQAYGLGVFIKKKSYHIWLDKTRNEQMYGVLNLGATQFSTYKNPDDYKAAINGNYGKINCFTYSTETLDKGAASDINFSIDDSKNYASQDNPTLLANDTYSVNAPGVSGSITPYRLETGSVGMPMEMTDDHTRFATLPYLNTYQVPFIYEGNVFNGYSYHSGNSTVSAPSTPTAYNYGLDCSVGLLSLSLYMDDYIFSNRIKPDLINIKKVPQGNDIAWFSNLEVKSANGDGSLKGPRGFIDFLKSDIQDSNSDRFKFRTNAAVTNTSPFTTSFSTTVLNFTTNIPINDKAFLNQLTVGNQITLQIALNYVLCTITAKDDTSITINSSPTFTSFLNTPQSLTLRYGITPQLDNKIGGYKITGMDGTSYHFALPVYGYDERSESISIADSSNRSILNRYTPFASSWLLTAITGPDYVDRNANGLADESDWGYWVKMNYGSYLNNFEWRIPFTGTMNDVTGTYRSYERGQKQLYYLNSIETRSHVAVFMKSSRYDGYDAKMLNSTLKLDEICLLKKEQYKKLMAAPYNITDYSNTISTLCNSSQYSSNSATRDYINRNCLKRIIFNYSYDLCKGAPNTNISSNPQKGKLTLTGISIRGRNDLKIAPDYKFEYANNPLYNANNWDGWGMYSTSGHATSDPTSNLGSAWSLTKLTNPLGSEISITYERDTYGTISGEPVDPVLSNYTTALSVETTAGDGVKILPVSSSIINVIKPGDLITISGTIFYTCGSYSGSKNYSQIEATVSSVNTILNQIVLSSSYASVTNCENPTHITITGNNGTLQKTRGNKNGGNIRVGSISMRDEVGHENKLRYLYNNDDGTSSGVVSQEPDFIKVIHYPFYDYLKYPRTPVMYGKVSVLSGRLSTDSDYSSKQVFEFETPHKSQYSFVAEDHPKANTDWSAYREVLFKIEDRTSKAGKLKSVKIMDHSDNISSQSSLSYTETVLNNNINNYQGIFSEGTILMERLGYGYLYLPIFRLYRTTALSFPYALKKIENTKDALTSSSENLSWDLMTGATTQKLDKSSLGVYVKSVIKPAYTIPSYSEFNSKAYDGNNKNMLSQVAATYSYRSDATGNELGLISAEVQTWRNDWTNYRLYNASGYADEGVQTNKIWRKGPSYVWKGSYGMLQQDYGTQAFAASNDFDFTANAVNPFWQYTGEMTRFDHYGMPLETVDMTKKLYSATKMGYNNSTIIASAGNASYNEIAFSSAEDIVADGVVPTGTYFGGEVALGAGTTVSTPVHTGNTALSVTAGTNKYGFVFKSAALSTAKTYRASVWANSVDGRIYYKLNNGAEVLPAQKISGAVAIPGMGNWYRIDITLANPASSVIEIGVKAQSGTVVFDDFRFQPADAVMQCYVYPPHDFEFTASSATYSSFSYILDNDNLFTKYEMNEKGELVKIYNESFRYGVKIISESKSNYRGFNN